MDARISFGRATSVAIVSIGIAMAAGCFADYGRGGRQHYRGGGGYAGTTGGGYGGAGGSGAVSCSGGTTSNFRVGWTIEDATGAPSSCAMVAAVEMDLDVVNLDTHTAYHAAFDCAAMSGTTCALPAGTYSLTMQLRDARGAVLSELIAPTSVAIVTGRTTDLGVIPFLSAQGQPGTGGTGGGVDAAAGGAGGQDGGSPADGGSGADWGGSPPDAAGSDGGGAVDAPGTDQGISLTWTIVRGATTLTCAQAAAANVEVEVDTATGTAQKYELGCGTGQGRTPTIPPGSYPVTLRLLDAQSNVLSETTTMTVAIPAGQVVNLGAVVFQVL